MDARQLQLLLPLVLAIAGPVVAKYGITNDQLSTAIQALFAAGSAIWGIAITMRSARLKSAATTSGVAKLVMDTQAGADALAPRDANGQPMHDAILSPSEDLAHVAASPGVAAVVMKSAAAADLNPSDKVVGPARLVAAPVPKSA